ncbi:MAG: class I SAM-dependent methyltransferase [Armatimonadetes bacterium]|nr:class I SAM-dependent methyltransferase [Armatimonadota bacterium]
MAGLKAAIKFGVHHVWFAGRDLLQPPLDLLRRVGIKPGDCVVDFGCGSGSYSLPAAALAGPTGQVFAVDENPHALRCVERTIRGEQVTNVTPIASDGRLPLESDSVDVVLLYDVLHDVRDQENALQELRRVLKPDGLLSVRDHHLSEQRLKDAIARPGLFRFVSVRRGLYRFAPEEIEAL